MDFFNELQKFLAGQGFGRVKTSGGTILWMKEETHLVKLVEVVPEVLPGQDRQPVEQQEETIRRLENQVMIRYGKKADRLTLMLFRGMPGERVIDEIGPFENIWCVDQSSGNLLLYEHQRSDFYGMREPLEQFLEHMKQKEKSENLKEWQRMFQPVNTALVVINILVFILLSLLGDVTDAEFMADHGAMVWSGVVEQGEVYRLFTSMFLHFGADHLLQNMLILLLVGSRLERITGRMRYLGIYLGAGIVSSVASLFFTLAREPYSVSAGASGAIFGVMGGLLFLILKDVFQKRRHRIREIGLVGMMFMIVGALSYGFSTTGVDNAAHVGGLIAGFVFTGLLMVKK
ncbi:MAG: rhomboid family intramembrane serine protease [Clostridiales bacterium]|nr:rhomboid family intramembrane serine protease [Clostridiales bacterium]